MNVIKLKLYPDAQDNTKLVEPPMYAHKDDAGMDLQANIPTAEYIFPGDNKIIPTGIAVQLPQSLKENWVYELQIRSRSGLAAKQSLSVGNSPGTIDAGYTGQIFVILQNNGNESIKIEPKQKIAQAVLNLVPKITWQLVQDFEETDRGSNGFGSTDN